MKGEAENPLLDGRVVSRISAYLSVGDLDSSPSKLTANARRAFVGANILGLGFTFNDVTAVEGTSESLEFMRTKIAKEPRNNERIFPLIGGEEVTTDPRHQHHRFVIDFRDYPLRRDSTLPSWLSASEHNREQWLREGVVPSDYPDPVAADWPDLLEIVERLVKPARQLLRNNVDARRRKKFWWQYGRATPGLYAAISSLERVFVNSSKATPHHAIAILNSGYVYSQNLNVFALSNFSDFAAMQGRAHEVWARFVGTTMKDDFTYVKDDCFDSFPFPTRLDRLRELEIAGQSYHGHRAAVMIRRNEGMTKIYNRFHDRDEIAEDIQCLRELHAALDRAVLEAYGWDDLAARAAPVFLDETNEDDHTYQGRLFWPTDFRDEVLAHLLALNAERHAEEFRLGIGPGMKGKAEADDEDDESDDE